MSTRISIGLALVCDFALQSLVAFVNTLHDEDNDTATDKIIKAYAPILVPIIHMSVRIIMIDILRNQSANAAQKEFGQRLLVKNHGRNIGLIQTIAPPELLRDIENIGKHIDDASYVWLLFGEVANAIAISIYLRSAHDALPETRNILYIGSAVTALACYLQKSFTDEFNKSYNEFKSQDLNWKSRIETSIRHSVAVVLGHYQSAEVAATDKHTDLKSAAEIKYLTSGSKLLIMRNMVGMAFQPIMEATVKLFKPELIGTNALKQFSLSLTLYANALMRIMAFGPQFYSRSATGLKALRAIDEFFKELDELIASNLSTIQYEQTLSNNTVLQLKDFTMVIPGPQQTKSSNFDPVPAVLERVKQNLKTDTSRFIFKNANLSFNSGGVYRIYAPSGFGKSELLKILFGIRADCEVEVQYSCKRGQIYALPQTPMFFIGTLLENIYLLGPPIQFAGSIKEKELHELMRILGLGKQIELLNENKNWGSVLSAGEKKKISFLRLYLEMLDNKDNVLKSPKLLLLDELTSGLDGAHANIVERHVCLMREYFPDLCTIFIRHDEGIDLNSLNQVQKDFLERTERHASGLNDYTIINLMGSTKPLIFRKDNSTTDNSRGDNPHTMDNTGDIYNARYKRCNSW